LQVVQCTSKININLNSKLRKMQMADDAYGKDAGCRMRDGGCKKQHDGWQMTDGGWK
jgi:hypothetical protein